MSTKAGAAVSTGEETVSRIASRSGAGRSSGASSPANRSGAPIMIHARAAAARPGVASTPTIRCQSTRATLHAISPTIAGATSGRSIAARSGSRIPTNSDAASTGAAWRPSVSRARSAIMAPVGAVRPAWSSARAS
jgi:hypothetical protein